MKIALVTLRFDAPGGVEQNVREVAKGLHAAGEDVTVFASDLYAEDRWDRRSNYAPVVDGVPVRRFPVVKRLVPGLTMPLWPGLIPALSKSGASVIHAHSHRYGHVLQSAAAARRTKTPLVVSTHYHPADQREPAFKRGALRLQDRFFGMTAYQVASALVVESDLEARLVSEFAPAASGH
ncbi:MAG: glycosyltransferase family 4 protein, partial [Thermoplasmata archaeon]|nr:glycosyltransferase family 4 protein [Thermoplasmata archaeon]